MLLLVILAALAFRMTSPEDRQRYLGIALVFVRQLRVAAAETEPEREYRDSLRARTGRLLVTPALVAINVMVVAGILFSAGAIGDPDTLLAWGGSLGPRTTNGEWWRLVTSTFVHTGTLHLLVNVAVLIQIGAVLERLAGRLAFAGVYVAAGVFAGLVNLSSYPLAVTSGASAAIFGLYGLLLAIRLLAAVPASRRRTAAGGGSARRTTRRERRIHGDDSAEMDEEARSRCSSLLRVQRAERVRPHGGMDGAARGRDVRARSRAWRRQGKRRRRAARPP